VVERWWEDERWAVYLFPHVILIRAFLERRLTAVEFEVLFLAAFKAEGPRRPPEIFNVLERIFFDVDDFCPDEELGRCDPDVLDVMERGMVMATLYSQRMRGGYEY